MEEAWTDGRQRGKGRLQEVSCGFLVSAMTGKREKRRSIHLYRTLFPLSFSFFVRLEGGSSPVFRLLASLRGPTAALHRWGAWHRE